MPKGYFKFRQAGGLPNAHTCDQLEYSPAEVEFMMAMERFQRLHHRRPPTCRDVIRVAASLGYRLNVSSRCEE